MNDLVQEGMRDESLESPWDRLTWSSSSSEATNEEIQFEKVIKCSPQPE